MSTGFETSTSTQNLSIEHKYTNEPTKTETGWGEGVGWGGESGGRRGQRKGRRKETQKREYTTLTVKPWVFGLFSSSQDSKEANFMGTN